MVDKISDLIRCEICKKFLQDPVMLPCEEVCCKKCASSFANSGNNYYLCFFCQQEHQVPKSGFKVNKKIQSLIQSMVASRFRVLSESIKGKEAKFTFEEGIEKIKNHCSLLMYDVELKTKFAIDDINHIHDFLIDKIKQYEKKAIQHYENKEEYKNEIDTLDFTIEDFLEKFHLELNLDSLNEI